VCAVGATGVLAYGGHRYANGKSFLPPMLGTTKWTPLLKHPRLSLMSL
jgi:hypothetical protein